MEKKMWKLWDEFLVDAWEKDASMFMATLQFLTPYGITTKMLVARSPESYFADIGISSRAPKTCGQLHGPVRGFFNSFFPSANELLWQGRRLKALQAMRKYRVGTERIRMDREAELSRANARKKNSASLHLIPGTNAMRVVEVRRRTSDWNTVKPSRCRQRIGRM